MTSKTQPQAESPEVEKVEKTDAEWRETLSDDQYRVCRKHGTEPAFTGAYWNTKTSGTYLCACCGQALFSSDTKYDSGSGWPSFWQPLDAAAVGTQTDRSFMMTRTEVHCSRCGAHLGHVFPDGPQPTGDRYCINSVSLHLEPVPDLRADGETGGGKKAGEAKGS
ncbi:MAG: peptide-methionine (R)-S-oxide reductase MsrB [Defluviicoccus sp.]|nr:MAG: peptide-methionine (R)-S-oxide reductase MsrB [Defluviicoccus sp.]